jgi:hypothetical protein
LHRPHRRGPRPRCRLRRLDLHGGRSPRLFLTFRGSSGISRKNNLLSCGAAAATVSVPKSFTTAATGTRTH